MHTRHVSREIRNACRLLVGMSKEKIPLRRPKLIWGDNIKNGSRTNKMGACRLESFSFRVDERRILKRIFKKWDGEAWTGFLWRGVGTGGGRF
jgi:hypothetical protein